MAKTLHQILGSETLTGVIQTVKPGVPKAMPDPFYAVNRRIEGDQGTYTRVNGHRQTARLVARGSKARVRDRKGIAEVPVKLATMFEQMTHEAAVLHNLRNYENEARQRLGVAEISRHTRDFRGYFENLRISMVHSLFSLGAIYFDGDGNLLPSSSGAVYTLDFSVPAGHKDQLDIDGSGDIISASWATASTDIVGQVNAIKAAVLRKNGYALKHAYYGENILGYLLANDSVQAAMNSHPGLAAAFMQGQVADGFLGMKWHPMDGAFFDDENGDTQAWWPADQVVFTPDPSPEWYEVMEGSHPVPASLGNVSADGVAALGDIREATGMYSYAAITHNPVGIDQFFGDTFLPILKVPASIAIADVTP